MEFRVLTSCNRGCHVLFCHHDCWPLALAERPSSEPWLLRLSSPRRFLCSSHSLPTTLRINDLKRLFSKFAAQTGTSLASTAGSRRQSRHGLVLLPSNMTDSAAWELGHMGRGVLRATPRPRSQWRKALARLSPKGSQPFGGGDDQV